MAEARRSGEVVPLSIRQLALLGLLALEGSEGIGISSLVSELWTAGTDSSLRNLLRKDVCRIRADLQCGDVILTREQRYVLNLDMVHSDLQDFDILLAEGHMLKAATLVRGGILASIRNDLTAGAMTRVDASELRLRKRLREASLQQWKSSQVSGRWSPAEDAARALLTLDSGCELALRRLMRTLALHGRPEEAAGILTSFTEEMNGQSRFAGSWSPSPPTVRLRNQLPRLARWRKSVGGSDRFPLPLVGRETEMHRISRVLQAPSLNGVDIVQIKAVPGLGKSRLAREAIMAAARADARILCCQGTDGTQQFILSTLVGSLTPDWLADTVKQLPNSWQRTLMEWAPGLHGDDSGLDVDDPEVKDLGLVTRRTAHAFLELFTHAARSNSVILFIDDVDRADQGTITVLEYVCNHWRRGSLAIVATEGPDTDRLYRCSACEKVQVTLTPWTEREVRLILNNGFDLSSFKDVLAGCTTPEEPVRPEKELCLLTGGRPKRIVAILDSLRPSDNRQPPSAEARVREATLQFLENTLARASRDARELLEVLTYWSDGAPISELFKVSDLAEPRTSSALRELLAAELVKWEGERARFAHPLIGDIMRTRVGSIDCPAIHKRIAEVLRERGDDGSHVRAIPHFFHAGLFADATAATLEAAIRAEGRGRIADVLSILELAHRRGQGRPALRARIAVRFAEALLSTGRFTEAEQVFRSAIELSRRLPSTAVEFRARVGRLHSMAARSGFVDTSLLQPLDSLMEQMQRTGVCAELPAALELKIRIVSRTGDPSMVRTALRQAQELSSWAIHPVRKRLDLLRQVELFHSQAAEVSDSSTFSEASLVAASDPELALEVLNWKVIRRVMAGELGLPECIALRREAAACLDTHSHPLARFRLQSNLGVWYLDAGDLEGAQAALSRAEQIMGDLPMPAGRFNFWVNMGELELNRRNYTCARDAFALARSGPPPVPSHPAWGVATAGLALANLGVGKISRARDLVEMLPEIASPYPFNHALVAFARARVQAASGSREDAVTTLAAGAKHLHGRFKLGWAKLVIEGVRIYPSVARSQSELRAFLERNQLSHLQSQLHSVSKPYRSPTT